MLGISSLDPLGLAWMGAIFLFFGEVAALLALPSLGRVVLFSTIAEVGYLLIGLGVGGPAGDVGATMHLGYQIVMRGLVVAAGWYLVARTRSANLDDLRGSGRRMPVAATLFAFGVFAVMGLSPFKGSFSKFMILYAAIEQGHWGVAIVGTAATVVAAAYYLLLVQRVCLEPETRPVELAPAPSALLPIAAVLAALTAVLGLWPEPLVEAAVALTGTTDVAAIPHFEAPWSTLVLAPYVGGFAIWAIGRRAPRLRDAAAVLLVLATLALVALDASLDPASRLFALIFAGIASVMVIYSVDYMAGNANANRYWFFAFLMIGSLIGLTTTHELGNFYVFWELMTWTSYFLVVHDESPKALKAGFVYFLMCAGGAYVMHFGILLAHANVHSFEFAVLAERLPTVSPIVGFVTVAAFFVGFAVKAGLVPMQAWLPLAHPVAPSSVSGPLSGILTKAGVFGMVKVLFLVVGLGALKGFAVHGVDLSTILVVLGALTLIYGEVRALFEPELKRMLAFSTLAQVGEIVAILGLGTALAVDASLLHVMNHAAMKTLLFFAAGAFILRTGHHMIADFAGLGRKMPVTAGAYALASIAVMGLPPFNGFVSKFLMVWAAVDAGHWEIATLLLLGGLAGAVYYLRVVATLFFKPWTDADDVREAPASMLAALGLLAAVIVIGGVAPSAQLALVTPVGAAFAARAGLADAVLPNLQLIWPAAAIVAFLGAGLVWLIGRKSVVWSGRLAVLVLVAAFVAILLERGRWDGLSFAFALLITGVGALNMLHATAYLAHSHAQGRFFAAFGLMIAGLIGLTAARDVFSFFGFWEVMSSWALWAAIVHEETDEARREGFKYFFFNTVGASFMFLGLVVLATAAGTTDLAGIGRAAATMPTLALSTGLVTVVLGLVMKAAQLPLRIDVQMHPALAPTPVSGYISAVLLKSGPWGVLKLFTLFGGAAVFTRVGGSLFGLPTLMEVVATIGAITILIAGAQAFIQNGIKLVLIWSTVCQLGYVMMAVSLGTSLGVAAGLAHFVNHMLLKDTLFLVAGAIMVANHATMLDELGGLGRKMPFTFGCFLFAGLSLAGIPPLNGFASKWMIFDACFASGHWAFAVAAMIGSLFTLAAVLKFAHAAFMGAPTTRALQAQEAPLAMRVSMGVLVAASVIVGLMPGLVLVPIAAIQAELGMTPIVATLTGGLPGPDGWHPGLVSVLLLIVATPLVPYLRLAYRGAGVQRIRVHQAGADDLVPEEIRMRASSLFETPDAIVRGLLKRDGETSGSQEKHA
ncbi:MAG: oxidoreductase [Hyphomicrobiales bacterium]|nr:oxidoreductase [Hyphomicrobiales bacterium]